MIQKNLNLTDYYSSSDLALVATISLWFPIEVIDRSNPSKALFLFKRQPELDKLLEEFWRGDVRIEPKLYFAQLKVIKSRLYSSG